MKKIVVSIILFLWYGNPVFAEVSEIRFFNWSNYLPEEVLTRFTEETGIKVQYSTYDSNEVMYAKLKLLDGKGYDLVVPSTYYVDKMRREGLLHPLEREKLPGFSYLDVRLLNQTFDPGNIYSVPYLWGSTGLTINIKKTSPNDLHTWADMWKPSFKKRLLLPNDMREVFFIGLKVLGYSGNTTHPEEISKAYEKLKQLMPNVRLFHSDAPEILYITDEIDAGVTWNGNAYRANQEDENIRYIYPKEGTLFWMDNLVIPKGAEHIESAHRFIAFLLRPEIAQIISEKLGYASPNLESVKYMSPAWRTNMTIYPSDEEVKKAEYTIDVGSAITLYTYYWEKLKLVE